MLIMSKFPNWWKQLLIAVTERDRPIKIIQESAPWELAALLLQDIRHNVS